MNGLNAQFGSDQKYGSISSNGFGNQHLQGTLSMEQYAYANNLAMSESESSTLNQADKNSKPSTESDNSELVVENVAASALAHTQNQSSITNSENNQSQDKKDLSSSNNGNSKSEPEKVIKIDPKEQTFVHMKSRRKNRGKNKGQQNVVNNLANEPHNKESKSSEPIVHVEEPQVKVNNKFNDQEYYEFSIPFGRRARIKVMNEPNRVKNNIGLTQTSFDRFDRPPVMRVAAYGFSGPDYTELARTPQERDYLNEVVNSPRVIKDTEVPYSHANEYLSDNFYGRDHSLMNLSAAMRNHRAKSINQTRSFGSRANVINAQFFSASDIRPFYSTQKLVNGTRVSINAFTYNDRMAMVFGQKLARSIMEQNHNQVAYAASGAPHVTVAPSNSTNITYALPPVVEGATHAAESTLYLVHKRKAQEQALALEQAQEQELQKKAHEIQSDIMEQGHTILSGNVSYARPEKHAEQYIVIVRAKPRAFETSGEVKTIIRNKKALAMHGINAQVLAEQELIRLSQQVTLPEDYVAHVTQSPLENSVFEYAPQTLLGSETTRIVATTSKATKSFGRYFQAHIDDVLESMESSVKDEHDDALASEEQHDDALALEQKPESLLEQFLETAKEQEQEQAQEQVKDDAHHIETVEAIAIEEQDQDLERVQESEVTEEKATKKAAKTLTRRKR